MKLLSFLKGDKHIKLNYLNTFARVDTYYDFTKILN